MKVKLKDNMWIDGKNYAGGKVAELPDWLAVIYIREGYAERPVYTQEFKRDFKEVKKSKGPSKK